MQRSETLGALSILILLCGLFAAIALRLNTEGIWDCILKTAEAFAAFVAAIVLLSLLEHLWPEKAYATGVDRELKASFACFVAHALIVSRVVVLVSTLFFAWLLITHVPRLPPTWLTNQPQPFQFIEALLIREFLSYSMHWAMHNNTFLWRFHAVHHSSETLSWHSALRNHPGENFLTAVITILPLYCMGLRLPVIGAVVNGVTIYDMFVHSNIRVNLGLLNYLIVTPEFHRWHHTNEPDKLNRNYGASLPIYDYLFGTAIKHGGEPSKSYGLYDESIPPSFIELLKYPFRRVSPNCKPEEHDQHRPC